MPAATSLDAIDEALKELNPPAAADTPNPGEEAEEQEVEGKEGDDKGEVTETDEEKTAREAKEAELANETPEAKATREKAEADAAEAAKAAETPEAKATREAAEAAALAAKKPADPINDPIPATVSQRTRERITSLVGAVKERDARIAEQHTLFESVQSTGVTGENFAQTLTVLRLFNSPNIEDKRQAYTFLKQQVDGLAKVLGETTPGANPLEGHADLQEEVAARAITQARAEEIAVTRNREAARVAAATAATSNEAAVATEWNNARTTAIAALNAIGKVLQAADTQYQARAAALMTELKDTMAGLHPSQWADKFHTAYLAKHPLGAPAPAPNLTPTPPKGPQPMRPNKQPASGGPAKAPTTGLEAIEAGLSALKG